MRFEPGSAAKPATAPQLVDTDPNRPCMTWSLRDPIQLEARPIPSRGGHNQSSPGRHVERTAHGRHVERTAHTHLHPDARAANGAPPSVKGVCSRSPSSALSSPRTRSEPRTGGRTPRRTLAVPRTTTGKQAGPRARGSAREPDVLPVGPGLRQRASASVRWRAPTTRRTAARATRPPAQRGHRSDVLRAEEREPSVRTRGARR